MNQGLASTRRRNLSAAVRRAAIEAIERRVLLSASLSYIPVDATGQLGPPVVFDLGAGTPTAVEDYAPPQRSLLATGFAAAQFDVFLKLDGIDGESTDDKHKGAIEISSFSWGADSAFGAGGGGGAGKASFQDIHFTAKASKASPKLLESSAKGNHIPSATLFVRSKGDKPVEFLQVTLQDVLVSSYQVQGHDDLPTEQFSLNFTKIEYKYIPQNADGSLGTPIVFTSSGTEVKPFLPAVQSLLDDGPPTTQATADYYLELDGIKGESSDAKHKDWIEIESFSWGMNQTVLAGGLGSAFQELHVTSRLSSATPVIVGRLATGQHIPDATLTVRKAGATQNDFYQVTLTDVLVSSYQTRTDAGGMVEEVSFNYGKIEYKYTPQNADGSAGNPVVYNSGNAALLVNDYSSVQRSVIDAGVVDPRSVDFFLLLDGVKGESVDSGHKDWIDILSYSWGADAVVGQRGATFDELHVVTRATTASPQLLANLSTGGTKQIATSSLAARRSDDKADYLRYELKNVMITSYSTSTGEDGTLLEEFTLNFGNVVQKVIPPPPTGGTGTPVVFDSGAGAQTRSVKPPELSLITDGTAPLAAAFDAFLDIQGIPGETEDTQHKGQIEIESFSWGANQTFGSGGGAGKVSFQDIHFTTKVSKASPLLMQALATGQHIPKATLFVRKAGGDRQEFYQITLQDVLVSSYQSGDSSGGDTLPTEEVTLNFATAAQKVLPPAGSTSQEQSFQTPATAEVGRFSPEQRALLPAVQPPPATAAVDMFLKIEGIDGESSDSKHKGEIEILSYSFGASQAGATGGGGGAGKVSMQDFHFVARVSKATPKLMLACATGQHIKSGILTLRRTVGAAPLEYLTIMLEDALISSYQTAQAGDGSVLEEFTLSTPKMSEKYVPPTAGEAPVTFTSPQQGILIGLFQPTQSSLIGLLRTADAPGDLFLKMDGVEGGSADSKHKGEIEILSYSWGVSQAGASSSGGGGGAGKAVFQDLHFVAHASVASPLLLNGQEKGKLIPYVTLTARKAGGTQAEYLTIKLQDVLVSSYQVTTAPDGTLLEEGTLRLDLSPPTLAATTIGDGSDQRSMVRSFSLTFDRPVALGDGSVRLELLNTGGSGKNDNSPATDASSALGSPTSADDKTYVFPFVGGSAFVQNGSLVDGIFRLSVDPTKVNSFGVPMTAAPQPVTFHRLFGDVNGSKTVNNGDFGLFRNAFNKSAGQSGFDAAFDFDSNGTVNNGDFGQFRLRFGKAFLYG